MQPIIYIDVMSCRCATYREEEGMTETMTFKAWLVINKVSQRELADLLGLSQQSVYLKVNGKVDFTLPQIKKICDTYGVSADIFLK